MFKLGRKAAELDWRSLNFADFLTSPLPLPGTYDKFGIVQDWLMFLNDTLGDCVIACMYHQIKYLQALIDQFPEITDETVLKAYEKIGHYVPGDPSTDQGVIMLRAMKQWRKGIPGPHGDDRISAFVVIPVEQSTTIPHIKQAVMLLEGVPIGIEMLKNVMAQAKRGEINWIYQPGPDAVSIGGHCVLVVGWDNTGFFVVSWGKIYHMAYNLFDHTCREAYGVVSTDDFSNGLSPDHYDIKELIARADALQSVAP